MLSADAFAAGLFGYNAPLSLSGVCLKARGPGECGGDWAGSNLIAPLNFEEFGKGFSLRLHG